MLLKIFSLATSAYFIIIILLKRSLVSLKIVHIIINSIRYSNFVWRNCIKLIIHVRYINFDKNYHADDIDNFINYIKIC